MTWYGKKRVLLPTILLGTALLAGCGPESAEDRPAAAKKLAAVAAPADAQTEADQEAAAEAAAEMDAKAAAEKAAAEKVAADKVAADRAAAEKAAADKAAAEKAAAEKAAAEKAAADEAAADKAAARQAAAAAAAAAAPAAAGAREYQNCTELRKDYRGGVARPGAVNKGGATQYEPHYDAALYEANVKSDRDDDDIACEA